MTRHELLARTRQLIRRWAWRLRIYQARNAATRTAASITQAYCERRKRKRVLFVEDRVPHNDLGAGFPRSNLIVAGLIRMGLSVTLYPTLVPNEEWSSVYRHLPLQVKVARGEGLSALPEYLRKWADTFDLLFVSRPHNFAALRPMLDERHRHLGKMRIIYDAEAIFSMREIGRMRQLGAPLSLEQERKLIGEELNIGNGSSAVVSVSEKESRVFAEHGFQHVYTLGHAVQVSPTPNTFESRSGLLFVGAIHGEETPNADSVIWFVREIFPLIRKSLASNLKFMVAGFGSAELKDKLAGEGVEVLGKVDNLTALYDRALMFVAPTRFAAGIPLKIYEAAAHGLPIVSTTLLATQLGWRHETELLTGDDAEAFAASCVRLYRDATLWERLRTNALDRLKSECSPEAFEARLGHIIEETLAAP